MAANSRKTKILLRPRLTEKSTWLSENRVYAFDVATDANKHEIADAVRALYNVTPSAVRIVRVPSKAVTRGVHVGRTSAGKKAYVVLPKGQSIEFV